MSLEHRPDFEEDLPKGFKVIKRLYRSPMQKEYIALAEFEEKGELRTAIIGFDGIEDTPIFIETYYQLTHQL